MLTVIAPSYVAPSCHAVSPQAVLRVCECLEPDLGLKARSPPVVR
jgi:hypothetical protein